MKRVVNPLENDSDDVSDDGELEADLDEEEEAESLRRTMVSGPPSG